MWNNFDEGKTLVWLQLGLLAMTDVFTGLMKH